MRQGTLSSRRQYLFGSCDAAVMSAMVKLPRTDNRLAASAALLSQVRSFSVSATVLAAWNDRRSDAARGVGNQGGSRHPSQQGGNRHHRPQPSTNSKANNNNNNNNINKNSHHRPTRYQENLASDVQTQGEESFKPLTLEEKLQRRFGPHAKLVVREQHNKAQPSSPSSPPDDAAQGGRNGTANIKSFKGSVTFKQLGFPVEIAVVSGSTFDQVEALAFETAMNSNIIALHPQMFRSGATTRGGLEGGGSSGGGGGEALRELRELKSTVDTLRNACQMLGRVLKFSVKPKLSKSHPTPAATSAPDGNPRDAEAPPQEGSPPPAAPPPTYGCRAYFRDDWSVTASLSFLHEGKGFSPNDALSNCLRELCQRFQQELASDAYVKAEFHEAVRVLDLHGKTVEANVVRLGAAASSTPTSSASVDGQQPPPEMQQQQEPSEQQEPPLAQSYSVVARVTESATSNTYEVRSAEQPSLVDAYRGVALQIFLAEANATTSASGRALLDYHDAPASGGKCQHNSTSDDASCITSGWLGLRPHSAASRTVGGNVFTLADQAATKPLMLKLRHQCEGMLYHALESQLFRRKEECEEGNPSVAAPESERLGSIADVARDMMTVHLEEIAPTGGLTLVSSSPTGASAVDSSKVEITPASGPLNNQRVVSTRLYSYRATATLNGEIVGHSEGSGAYRVELDAWIQLQSHLIDLFPEIARFHFAHCFPTLEVLERAAHHHDYFRMFNHKGKWSPYGVLGTIVSTLVTDGGFHHHSGGGGNSSNNRFDKVLTDFDGTNPSCRAEAKIVVNDGYDSKRMLARRFGPQRGHAYRMAVVDAIQHNFPNQFDIAIQHEEFGSTTDTDEHMSSHGRRLRALPREKRVAHVNQLFGVIGCFAEEDYGWRALRIRTRTIAGDSSRCIAELEAQVQGERGRRIVAASPIAATAKNAKKLLIFQVCKQYFPKDLENYKNLGRGDARHPEALMSDHQICRVYSPATPFFAQVLVLLDKAQPHLSPFSWRVERLSRPRDGERQCKSNSAADDDDGSEESFLKPLYVRFKATMYGNSGDVVVAERLGNEGEGALAVVRSVLRGTCATYMKDVADSFEMWKEFETSPPPPVSSTHDLCNVLFQLSLGGLGGGDGSSRDATSTQQQIAAMGKPCIEVPCTKVQAGGGSGFNWWLATVVMPNMAFVAIARAAGRTKREAHRSALILAARNNFAKQLRFYSKHFVEVQSFADEIFHESVITEPTGMVDDVRKTPTTTPDTAPHSSSSSVEQWTPKSLLEDCLASEGGTHQRLVIHQTQQVGGSTWECRLYKQQTSKPAPHGCSSDEKGGEGEDEIQIGFGCGLSKPAALHAACTTALEQHFPAIFATRSMLRSETSFSSLEEEPAHRVS